MIGGTVGYTYQAENLCPSCTIKAMRANGITVQKGKPHEDAIRAAAEKRGVDFGDEHSCDSGGFPKPITDQQCGATELTELPNGETGRIPDERCTGDKCGKWLKLGEKSPTEAGLTRYVRDAYELPHALGREIARLLREWGLSHPEFIKEEDARQAAALLPHDYVTVYAKGNPQRIVLLPTPQYDNDPCFYCEQPWEKHTFTSKTCDENVPADAPHGHEVQVTGQIKFREAKPTT